MERYAAWLDAHRGLAAAIVVAVCAVALAGAARLEIHVDPRDLFRTDDERMATLERVSEMFGDDDRECLVLLEGDAIGSADLARVTAALRARPEIAWVIGPGDGPSAVSRRLVTDDGTAMLLLARMRDDVDVIDVLAGRANPIAQAASDAVAGTGVRVTISGVPAVRGELFDMLVREQGLFIVAGSAAGALVCFVLLRRVLAVVLATVSAVTGALWTMGALGLVGEPINPVNSVIPTIVLMVGYTDAIHLLYAIRRGITAGETPRDAARRAITTVGPACALTSLTTAIGFASLATARLDVIERFGVSAAVGAGLGFAAVISVLPLLAGGWLGPRLVPRKGAGAARPERPLPGPLRLVLDRPRVVAIAGGLLSVLLALTATQLVASTQLREGLPDTSPAAKAVGTIDREFGGVLTLLVLVERRADAPAPIDDALLAVIADVETALAETGVPGAPLSLCTVLDALPSGATDPVRAAALLGLVPEPIRRRVVTPDGRAALVTAAVPDEGTHLQIPMLDAVRVRLATLEATHPAFTLTLTGNPVAVGEAADLMIRDLAISLAVAAGVILIVMTIAFRSFTLAALCVGPNVFPLVTAGALLVLVDHPLTVTAVITFCVSLGIAVDDTLHVVVRLRHELRTGASVRDALDVTLRRVGGPLLTTTLVLVGGFATLVFSGMPMLRLFGVLCAVALTAALVGDLVLLPALLASCQRVVERALRPRGGSR